MSGFIELTTGYLKEVPVGKWKFISNGPAFYRKDKILAVSQDTLYTRVSFNPDFMDAIKVSESAISIIERLNK